jgi:hypothetical protein
MIMTISPQLQQVILDKALGKDVNADPLLLQLLDIYMNDKNSSTMRELITVLLAGYESIPGKLGRDALDTRTNKEKECKPKNFNGTSPQRGEGCFNDYTRKRFEQDLTDSLDIVGSLFVDGQCAFVVEYSIDAIKDKLEKQVHDKCEVKSNAYVRSASWAYDSYINHDSFKMHYINEDLINNNPNCMVKPFRTAILAHAALSGMTDKQH